MATKPSEAATLLDIILTAPGMEGEIKIPIAISRKNILILSQVVERGLEAIKDGDSGLLANVPAEALQEVKIFSDQCLEKAQLADLNRKIQQLGNMK